MTSRRERERSGRYDEDDQEPPRRSGYEERRRGDTPREPKKAKGDNLNEYFIDGKGISREVLQREICYFLGPDAVSKPGVFKGVDGYMIKAVRPFTSEMLDDLVRISDKYNQENKEMKNKRGRGLPYSDSRIGGQRANLAPLSDQDEDIEMGSDDSRDDRRPVRTARRPRERDTYESQKPREYETYQSRGAERYETGSAQPAYGRNLPYENPPLANPYPGRGPYEQNAPPSAYTYAPQPASTTPGYPTATRPGNTNSYPYADPSGISHDPYGKSSIYSQPPGRDAPRRTDPREYPQRDPYDGRVETTRYSEYNAPPPGGRSMPPVDPYYDEPRAVYSSGPSRMDTRMDQPAYDRDYQESSRDPYRAKRPVEESRRPRNF